MVKFYAGGDARAPIVAKESPILLDIIEDWHRRKSIVITSQYLMKNRYDAIGDPTVADASLTESYTYHIGLN